MYIGILRILVQVSVSGIKGSGLGIQVLICKCLKAGALFTVFVVWCCSLRFRILRCIVQDLGFRVWAKGFRA